ncbi:MAG TPA: hypothetical protein PKD14_12475, partial [Saprospiraceae bacterium]|nr:hypothetical protein [Saprospiraceae bacterium]
MKKLIKNGLLFSASLLVVYLLIFTVLFYIRPSGVPFIYRATQGNVSQGGGTWVKLKNFDATRKWDIIVLGSSHAYRGYDPTLFSRYGISMYNLGTSNQHMRCTYYIAKNHINRNNCKLILLDVYDRAFCSQQLESMSDLIQNAADDKTAIDIAFSTPDIRVINMLALRYFNKTIPLLNTDTTGFINGYKENRKYLNPVIADSIKLENKYKTNPLQVKYLIKLLTYFKSQGIPVVAAEHPLPSLYTVREHTKFISDIQPVFNQFNVPFLDHTYDPDIAGKLCYFFDPTHLNFRGVSKYNERLLKELVQMGILSGASANRAGL